MFRDSISDEGLNHAKIIHEDRVGLLSRLTFQWIFPLLSVSLWIVRLISLHITPVQSSPRLCIKIGYTRPLTRDNTRNQNLTLFEIQISYHSPRPNPFLGHGSNKLRPL